MTIRSVFDEVRNTLDYLSEAELSIFTNEVSMLDGRVSWYPLRRDVPFMRTHEHPTLDQFSEWVVGGHYSCLLFDGSLLQITYDIEDADVCGHRLAYIPCPVVLDTSLLQDEPVIDLVELYLADSPSSIALRTPVRFDFDPRSAKSGHPAAHMTINSVDCRIACVAPMHVGRFVDFVFRNFYAELRSAHAGFFDAAGRRHLGKKVIEDEHRMAPHLMWDLAAESFGGKPAARS